MLATNMGHRHLTHLLNLPHHDIMALSGWILSVSPRRVIVREEVPAVVRKRDLHRMRLH